MSDIYRTVTIYKDGSIGVDDERGIGKDHPDTPEWFTREDVEALRRLAAVAGVPNRWSSIADRIEALLPPEG